MTPAITVDDVSKRFRLIHDRNGTFKAMVMRGMKRVTYDEFWALRHLSFEVAQGETFALVGHNGSGKSTALKCLANIYRPDEGNVRLNGSMSALLELGAGFHVELSGRENVYLNASILGLPKKEIDRRFDDIVAFAGLERFIDTPVKNYSSGMFVRLGFSVAINVDPEILLVDEVLAVGDEEFQRRCLQKIRDIKADGRTVVVVTHSLDTVRQFCDRAVWLDHGEPQLLGTSQEVTDAYLYDVDQSDTRDPAAPERVSGIAAGLDNLGDGRATLGVHVELNDVPSGAQAIVDLLTVHGIHVAGVQRPVEPGSYRLDGRAEPLHIGPGEYIVRATLLDDQGHELGRRECHTQFVDLQRPDGIRGAHRVDFEFGMTPSDRSPTPRAN